MIPEPKLPNPTYKGEDLKKAFDSVRFYADFDGVRSNRASIFKSYYKIYKIRLN